MKACVQVHTCGRVCAKRKVGSHMTIGNSSHSCRLCNTVRFSGVCQSVPTHRNTAPSLKQAAGSRTAHISLLYPGKPANGTPSSTEYNGPHEHCSRQHMIPCCQCRLESVEPVKHGKTVHGRGVREICRQVIMMLQLLQQPNQPNCLSQSKLEKLPQVRGEEVSSQSGAKTKARQTRVQYIKYGSKTNEAFQWKPLPILSVPEARTECIHKACLSIPTQMVLQIAN